MNSHKVAGWRIYYKAKSIRTELAQTHRNF